MPRTSHVRIPSYRLHAPTGQAVVRLSGRDFYLGPWQSERSKVEYQRLTAEWLANHRSLPAAASWGQADLTINELLASYLAYAKGYYQKNGEETSEVCCIRVAMRELARLYGHTPAGRFGPLALKAVRQQLVDRGLCRKTINGMISRMKRCFKWGVENEVLPPSVYHGLAAVNGLRRNRTEAKETAPVLPVSNALVDAVQPVVSRQVWAIVELMRLTVARCGEIIAMRGMDLDVSGEVWLYRPSSHKTAHYGHERIIDLGPKAQAVVKSFLK